MALVQYIYNTTNIPNMAPDKGVLVSVKSVEICDRLGMTGRVFSSRKQALSITEGPTDVMRQYFEALETQPHIETVLLQSVRDIETREFDDYSVWLDIDYPFEPHPKVHPMTSGSLAVAMPKSPSVRLRVMIDAFFDEGRFVS
jgi:hypothetical protein